MRAQSAGEEIANSISHGLALLGAIVTSPLLIADAVQRGDVYAIVGSCVFALTMILLYLTSTLYHALPRGGAKNLFQVLDHMAIYLMIAGTYTPFALGVMRGTWGWTLFGLVWGCALAGILLKSLVGVRYMLLSTVLYVVMGWGAILAVMPIWDRVPRDSFAWLLAGGVVYTVGVLFFLVDHKIRYGHLIWHLFVTSGTVCHIIAVHSHGA